jgi:hypothetical protein
VDLQRAAAELLGGDPVAWETGTTVWYLYAILTTS